MSARCEHHLQLAVNRNGVIARRGFLRACSAASLATGAWAWTDALRSNADELRRRGKACILLWMQGGPSQLETFDPKPEHANGGETKAIDTSVPGIRIAENLPRLAKVAHQLAILRSMSTREGEHARAGYLMHTSYLPMASVQYPSLGAVAAHEIARAACELPAFVRIGLQGPGLTGGGFLGTQYDAFTVASPARPPENTRIATDTGRFQERLGLLGRMQSASAQRISADDQEHQKLYASASRMILSPQMQAFELDRETAEAREAYGSTPFGSACLLARRLIEAGVTFVETGVPGWDTHDNNFERSRTLCGQLDQPFAQLLADLDQRGLLDSTLVVWMGEFGRTPRINPRAGRDHFPRGFSAVLAGGGVRGGQVVGATDAAGESIADRPISEKDLFQTVYKSLGVDASKHLLSPIGRPIKFVDGGAPLDDLLG